MDLNDRIFKELEAHTSDFNSITSPSVDEKLDAYRKQWVILDQITSTSSESERMSIYRSQLKEFRINTDNTYDTFIQERCNKVQKLLPIPPSFKGMHLTAKEFLADNQIKLENECSGKYQSCRHDEATADDLKMFEMNFSMNQPLAQNKSPTRKDPKPFVPRMEPSTTFGQSSSKFTGFRTAREELTIQNMKKNGDPSASKNLPQTLFNYGASKRSLGARHNGPSRFVPPIQQKENSSPTCTPPDSNDPIQSEPLDKRLQNIEPKMVELIKNEIMHKHKPVDWDDIAGLEYAKATIKEAVVWPMLRPDIFTGLRRPPRGILLFGPPGTGKTLIGKCIASQSKSTFFSISASSLTSKYIGDGEKMVRALFAVAAIHQPSVVFIDEIDSILTQRSETEHEASRRLKTEFLIQLDGAGTSDEERILIVGATNRPQELDEAARRRLVRRLYIPLPELSARVKILRNLLQTVSNSIRDEEILEIGRQTDGYSGADMETLCREASMEPIRSIPSNEISTFCAGSVRPVVLKDFHAALLRVRASVSQEDLQQYADWNRIFGAGQ